MLLTVMKMPPCTCKAKGKSFMSIISDLSTNQHTVTTVEVQTTSDWSNISLIYRRYLITFYCGQKSYGSIPIPNTHPTQYCGAM